MTTDGGNSWANFGNKNIGKDGGETVDNVGIVNGSAWGGNYAFLLQSDGDLRFTADGLGYTRIASPSAAAAPFVDIAYETGGTLWIVNVTGKTYKFATSGNVGEGTWTTLGSTYQTTVVAIGVNEIPEFRDIMIPMVGTVIVLVIARRTGRTRGRKGS